MAVCFCFLNIEPFFFFSGQGVEGCKRNSYVVDNFGEKKRLGEEGRNFYFSFYFMHFLLYISVYMALIFTTW